MLLWSDIRYIVYVVDSCGPDPSLSYLILTGSSYWCDRAGPKGILSWLGHRPIDLSGSRLAWKQAVPRIRIDRLPSSNT